jgi:predicted acylesterase/phospholipase RssA
VIREGSLIDFLIASFSIPCVFKAQEIGGKHYVDGGVVFEAPFGHLLDDPSVDTVVVHVDQVHPCRRRWWQPRGPCRRCW